MYIPFLSNAYWTDFISTCSGVERVQMVCRTCGNYQKSQDVPITIWNLPSCRKNVPTVEEKLQQYFEQQEKKLNVDFWYGYVNTIFSLFFLK